MILAFDTATRATAVALWAPDREEPAFEARDDPPRDARPRHSTRLMPLIVDVLGRAGAGWQQVERIAVGVGPGTFTGLRIGIATARALARARQLPLVGISTLESVALGGRLALRCVEPPLGAAPSDIDPAEIGCSETHRPASVLAVLDARRGEVFAACWPATGALAGPAPGPLLPPRALSPRELAEMIAPRGCAVLAIGDGAVEFRQVLEHSGAVVPEDGSRLHRVSAVNHCRLAIGRPAGGPDEVGPEYLRVPDAEIARRTKQ
jgi:tRNA threonylcarbamoyladenosine biosynthesis protein TsaB